MTYSEYMEYCLNMKTEEFERYINQYREISEISAEKLLKQVLNYMHLNVVV